MAKAWRISVSGFDDSITHADNRAKARYRSWRSAKDAGFSLGFGEIKVKRASEYDDCRYCGKVLDVCVIENLLKSGHVLRRD